MAAVGADSDGEGAAASGVAAASFAGFVDEVVVVVFVGRGGSVGGTTEGIKFVAGGGGIDAGRIAGVRESADDGKSAVSRCGRADSSAALVVISAFAVSALGSVLCSLPAVATDVGSFDVGDSEGIARVSITSGRTNVVRTNVLGSSSVEAPSPAATS
jgi:hypothetical protein